MLNMEKHRLCTPTLLEKVKCEFESETNRKKRSEVHSLTRNTSRVEGHARASGWELGKVTSDSIIHVGSHSPNNKLVSVRLEHFWCKKEPRAYTIS
jgi:hypothetical protein